jgi:ribonuclease BN (tRNA processing enzyme)
MPGNTSPAFLLDSTLLLDAGTIASALSETEQNRIETILISHSHLDHIKELPPLADNLLLSNKDKAHIRVVGIQETLHGLREHIFNNRIWPDFSRIPSVEQPVISWHTIKPELPEHLDGYEVTAIRVNHTVAAVGYLVRNNGSSILYTGDTGPTKRIWHYAAGVDMLITEVSLPNGHEDECRQIGHLTPKMLSEQLAEVQAPPIRILVMHLKPHFAEQIKFELYALGIPGLTVASPGDEWTF